MRTEKRPVALVTGVGRRAGIGAALVEKLAATGWDVAFNYWRPYDDRMDWTTADHEARENIGTRLTSHGAKWSAIEADLTEVEAPARLLDETAAALGPVRALVMAHCESVDSSILDTSVESFDRHFAINARATWLLVKAFAERYTEPHGSGRIVALTSDHTVNNLPYGASKGALDRIVLAAARELAHLGVTANVINPGPVDTGWMNDEIRTLALGATPLGRGGRPQDTANLLGFLCSEDGGWINGQLVMSNGGFAP